MSIFGDVIGHDRVTELLQREAPAAANAYLLVGASGVGKATVARRFATLLLCPEGGNHALVEGPEECRTCRRVMSGSHPDLILVEPEGRQSLGVDQARSTIAQAAL